MTLFGHRQVRFNRSVGVVSDQQLHTNQAGSPVRRFTRIFVVFSPSDSMSFRGQTDDGTSHPFDHPHHWLTSPA